MSTSNKPYPQLNYKSKTTSLCVKKLSKNYHKKVKKIAGIFHPAISRYRSIFSSIFFFLLENVGTEMFSSAAISAAYHPLRRNGMISISTSVKPQLPINASHSSLKKFNFIIFNCGLNALCQLFFNKLPECFV